MPIRHNIAGPSSLRNPQEFQNHQHLCAADAVLLPVKETKSCIKKVIKKSVIVTVLYYIDIYTAC